MRKSSLKKRRQTIIEYVMIIMLVVVASVALVSLFSDTIREKIAGIIHVFDPSADTSDVDTSSETIMHDLAP